MRSRSALRVPKVYHHTPTDQDAVVLRDPDGKRRTIYLGRHGTPEAQRRFREVLAEHLAGRPVIGARSARRQPAASDWPTVGQLCAAYLHWATGYYVGPDGKPTREVLNAEHAMAQLLRLHRDAPTDRFGFPEMQAVRLSSKRSSTGVVSTRRAVRRRTDCRGGRSTTACSVAGALFGVVSAAVSSLAPSGTS